MVDADLVELSAVVLPDRHPPVRFLDDVRAAERAGLRTVWTYDHLSWRDMRDGPWYGSVPLLSAAATVTSRIRFGPQVASPNFRHPVPFAKEIMTLDQLSGGRMELGLGAGTSAADALVLGEAARSPRERSDRFAEWLGLLDRLLTEPATTIYGPRFSAVDARQIPGCVQTPRVPFTVAAAGPRALRLAARFGQAWVTYGPVDSAADPGQWLAAVRGQGRDLDAALDELGRDRREVRRTVQLGLTTNWPFESAQRYQDLLGELAQSGFDEVAVHWPRPDDGQGVPVAALDLVLAAHPVAMARRSD